MRNRLASIKNIAWAFAIVVCLLAVFVGLLVAAFTRNHDEQFRGGVQAGLVDQVVGRFSGELLYLGEEAGAGGGHLLRKEGDGEGGIGEIL